MTVMEAVSMGVRARLLLHRRIHRPLGTSSWGRQRSRHPLMQARSSQPIPSCPDSSRTGASAVSAMPTSKPRGRLAAKD